MILEGYQVHLIHKTKYEYYYDPISKSSKTRVVNDFSAPTVKLFDYLNLIVLNISSSGEQISYTFIAKRQEKDRLKYDLPFSYNSDYEYNIDFKGSIYSTYYNNKIYIVYNDHVKNVKAGKFKEQLESFSRAQPVLIKISEDGSYEKKPLAEKYGKTRIKMNTLNTIRISGNEATLVDFGTHPKREFRKDVNWSDYKKYIRYGHLTFH